MLLTVENNLASLPTTQYSYLTANGTAGGTVVPIRNVSGFNANWAIQIGKTGEEQSEILLANGISGTSLTTSGTIVYPHPLDTPVYQVHYDQVIFLRSTSGTTVSPSAIATVAITPDSQFTEYNDPTGVSTYAYQVQYYNSLNGDLSGTSSWFSPGGPSWYSRQRLIKRAKDALYNADYLKDDSVVGDWINEWVELETNKALKVNEAYSIGTAAYAFGTAGLGTVTAPLFKYAQKVEITTDGITYRNSTKINLNQFESTDVYPNLRFFHYWAGDTVFGILPAGNAGTARFTMGNLSTQLVDDSDELPQYLRGYTTGCIEYVLYRAYDLDNKDKMADKHFNRHLQSEINFIKEITPRDFTGPQLIDLVEDITGENGLNFWL